MEPNIDRTMWGVGVLIIAVIVGVLAKDKIYNAVEGIFGKMTLALDGVNIGGLGGLGNAGGSENQTPGETPEQANLITIPEAKLQEIVASLQASALKQRLEDQSNNYKDVFSAKEDFVITIGGKTWSGSGDLVGVEISEDDQANGRLPYTYTAKNKITERAFLINEQSTVEAFMYEQTATINDPALVIHDETGDKITTRPLTTSNTKIDFSDVDLPFDLIDEEYMMRMDYDNKIGWTQMEFYGEAMVTSYSITGDFYFNGQLIQSNIPFSAMNATTINFPRAAVEGDAIVIIFKSSDGRQIAPYTEKIGNPLKLIDFVEGTAVLKGQTHPLKDVYLNISPDGKTASTYDFEYHRRNGETDFSFLNNFIKVTTDIEGYFEVDLKQINEHAKYREAERVVSETQTESMSGMTTYDYN